MAKTKEAGSRIPGQHPTVHLMYLHELPIAVASYAQAGTAPSEGYLQYDVKTGSAQERGAT
eukprot:16103812-Heterocapsa_arctica.AAC.1